MYEEDRKQAETQQAILIEQIKALETQFEEIVKGMKRAN
jgi:hypothetical protein